MGTATSTTSGLLVACLCADWCYICRDYQPVFQALQAEFGSRASFTWIDIEDDEGALGNVDVDDFPTLLIAHGDAVVFFGVVMARRDIASRLVHSAQRGESPAIGDVRLDGLAARIRALADAKRP